MIKTKLIESKLPGIVIIEPKVYEDTRGFFMELWNRNRYTELSIPSDFVQDNISLSARGVLRGLHFQHPNAQGKLVFVLSGEVFDVAVDLRFGSPNFGKWIGVTLSGENKRQLYIPEGFAHGFCVVSETALFGYKCTNYYNPTDEGGILWNDPDIGIEWPIKNPVMSAKDKNWPTLREIPGDRLPQFKV